MNRRAPPSLGRLMPARARSFLLSLCALAACQAPLHPWTRALRAELDGADRLVVRSNGNEPKVLLEVADAAQVRELIDGLHVDAASSGRWCACSGDPVLEFYCGERSLARVSVQHGTAIRWVGEPWDGDGHLVGDSGPFLCDWLAARGVSGPKWEVEWAKRKRREDRIHRERWVAAIPPPLKPFWDRMLDPRSEERVVADEMRVALRQHYPEERALLLALLDWLGSGTGRWGSHPSYESFATELLFDFDTQFVLANVSADELVMPRLEGVARFFGGWRFGNDRPGERASIPDALRVRLLEHATGPDADHDKRARARYAFGRD